MAVSAEISFTVETQIATFPALTLDCGVTLVDVDIAFETYGELNNERSNAILVVHAFRVTRTRLASAKRRASRAGGRP